MAILVDKINFSPEYVSFESNLPSKQFYMKSNEVKVKNIIDFDIRRFHQFCLISRTASFLT